MHFINIITPCIIVNGKMYLLIIERLKYIISQGGLEVVQLRRAAGSAPLSGAQVELRGPPRARCDPSTGPSHAVRAGFRGGWSNLRGGGFHGTC